ncbi:FMN-binding negative transcriptional regulator [Actibacterium lipolyticum]|uniref:Protease synthase and sporulation protein PAI 2 n=1 Tax=Actibacterium lipolyticum TaxID=1524263 RepID=A0A238KXK1_9RHOB|nr:FMN-binding negative transcriptional regulator [Actibacterium lipolyticum]SMX47543.1 Protease synthase and sporulation protein PAI 2 [Actibacterium lipolyticum]
MHPNPVFRKTTDAGNIAFAQKRAFGTLAANGDLGPLLAHVPFLLSDDGTVLEGHLVRSNPLARALPRDGVMAVTGPYSYISPDWYGIDDQVPTWNYIAVHLRGRLELRPQEMLHDLLDRQSALFEAQLLPKPPWTSDKMPDDLMVKMMRAIVPFRLQVDSIQGTWKLNQNKADVVRTSAAQEVAQNGIGLELDWLADLMRGAT